MGGARRDRRVFEQYCRCVSCMCRIGGTECGALQRGAGGFWGVMVCLSWERAEEGRRGWEREEDVVMVIVPL